jgi:hypothetical protein
LLHCNSHALPRLSFSLDFQSIISFDATISLVRSGNNFVTSDTSAYVDSFRLFLAVAVTLLNVHLKTSLFSLRICFVVKSHTINGSHSTLLSTSLNHANGQIAFVSFLSVFHVSLNPNQFCTQFCSHCHSVSHLLLRTHCRQYSALSSSFVLSFNISLAQPLFDRNPDNLFSASVIVFLASFVLPVVSFRVFSRFHLALFHAVLQLIHALPLAHE